MRLPMRRISFGVLTLTVPVTGHPSRRCNWFFKYSARMFCRTQASPLRNASPQRASTEALVRSTYDRKDGTRRGADDVRRWVVSGMTIAALLRHWVLEDVVIVWVALVAASVMTLLTLRSMAYAVANSVDARPRPIAVQRSTARRARRNYFRSHEAALLIVEIALSIGIAMTTIGLASMAALPGRMLVGALLAQFAVLGSLVAPAVTVKVGDVSVRPAAVALGLAQLANALFFVKAIYALV